MANRIDSTFRTLKRRREKALIGYLTAGFPSKASFRKLVPLLARAGLDLLEVGVPFSDPIADGPTIQKASEIALHNGVTLEWILREIKHLRQAGLSLPMVLMSYCNPIHAMGIQTFFPKAREAGVDGLIVPDLVPEEGLPYATAARKHHVDFIYLIAPTSPRSRIQYIARQTRGFLYAVSLTGVTGVRRVIPAEVARFLKSVRRLSRKPVAVGFGLSTPKQVHEISRHSDGVIVGSALIRAIADSKGSQFKRAAEFVRSMKGALHAA